MTAIQNSQPGAKRLDEQETIINISYSDKETYFYSSKPSVCQKMLGWLETHPEQTQCIHVDSEGVSMLIPSSWVRIRPPAVWTEERKKAASERLKAAKEAKKKEEAP